jgi:hypothetical protein
VRVVLFTKFPRPGLVKTRLARDIGPEHAAGLQTAFVRDELAMLSSLDAAVTLCCAPDRDLDEYRALFGPDPDYRAQRGADLGERMLRALDEALATDPDGAVLIGSDLPDLPAGHIRAACAALATATLCLGPAPDGGFCLLGARRPLPRDIFRDVVWGGEAVLEKTLANCRELNLTPALLSPWPDVDTWDDLLAFITRNTGRCSRTMAYVLAHGLLESTRKDPEPAWKP